MTRYCTQCREPFTAKGDWQRKCWDCWHAKRDGRAHHDDSARPRTYADGWRDGFRAGEAAARQAGSRRGGSELDADLLRDAVALTHPDRHPIERADAANRVTAALLQLRAGVEA
jgi:hypothetical protein